MGGGASKVGSSAVRGGGAYLKTEVYNDRVQELERQNKELRKELEEVRRELGNKMEDLRYSHEEMEDLTAKSFTRVKEQLTHTEQETKGLRSEVSHATACVGKMGGAVRKHRTGAERAEERLAAAEASVQQVEARLGRAEQALGDVDVVELRKGALARIDECEQATLQLKATTAKHTMTLAKQYEELTTHKKDTSSDAFGAQYQGFGTSANRTFAEIDALFNELAARMSEAERRADEAEVRDRAVVHSPPPLRHRMSRCVWGPTIPGARRGGAGPARGV